MSTYRAKITAIGKQSAWYSSRYLIGKVGRFEDDDLNNPGGLRSGIFYPEDKDFIRNVLFVDHVVFYRVRVQRIKEVQ